MKLTDGQFLTEEQISENLSRTPEGYLLCKNVTISRIGTFEYASSDVPSVKAVNGTVRMSRSSEELFSAETIASFEGKPVVVGHDDFVDPSNWSDVVVGTVNNVHQDGDNLVADLLLTTTEGIELVESGRLREVSCGYDAEAVDDGNGCGHQASIVGNHVALVQKARCGSQCAIKDGFSMENTLIEALRTAFEKADADAFEEALKALEATKDEEPEAKPEGDEAPEEDAPEADETKDAEGEVPPVEPEKSVEERLAVLEHEYQEIGAKLAKLLDVEKAEGHEELQGDEGEDVKDEEECDEDEIVASDEVQELIADAQEICEGMKTPTGDSADGKFSRGFCKRIMRKAIKGSGVNTFGDALTLDGRALDVAFKACVALARKGKNPSFVDGTRPDVKTDINARNKAFWAKH